MGIRDSAKGLATTLRLDSHHAIERFGVFFAIIAATFVLVFAGASTSSIANQRATLDSTTLYTPTFTTSKTQLSGDVSGIYVNSNNTRAMLLMQFKDASSMSANAKKFQAFLTGSTPTLGAQALKTNIHGEIVVFGTTGYMAMVLDSDKPFEQQILNLTMRANAQLVYKPSDTSKLRADLVGQKSFAEYDQWRLYFNPAASGAKTTTTLDGPQLNVGAIYNRLVIASQEKTARGAMDDQLAQMQVDLARIAEYQADARRVNVDGIRLQAPAVPEQIAGDVVTGKAAVGTTPSTLTFKPKWVSPSGFDFDWRSGNVAKGYLDQIVPKGQSYVTWLAAKAALSNDGTDGAMQVNNLQWKLSNGSLLSDYATSDSAMQPLFEIRNNLAQAYQDYFTHKLAYQVGAYSNLINLEVDLRNVRSSATTNDGKKVLFTY